ncbi:MAG: radical SAM protein, partial [Candidatus Methanofastidiosa archaeon]|nr:radical SAM protein [Candidatus Methanofastidiosa archaeon]
KLESCDLCPRSCRVNRIAGEKGYCGATDKLMVSSFAPHFGEEAPLVGTFGSGTIFLTNCPLKCEFCQNYDISINGMGREVSVGACSKMMLKLQAMGCHNINLVTPTHYAPQLVMAIAEAAEKGLRLPVVWNCGGYESLEAVRLLEGVVDIYMPDFKFHSGTASFRYAGARDYFERCSESTAEMHRQVGDLKIEGGIATRGVLIRHLVMPGLLKDSKEILEFIRSLSKEAYVNIMAQYRPMYKAFEHPEIDRAVTSEEVKEAISYARELGLHRGF